MRFRAALAAALLLFAGGVAVAEPVAIEATPFESFSRFNPLKQHFGRLDFLGGLVLKGQSAHFGGFSGLRLSSDGTRLSAISDRGYWLQARLVEDVALAPLRLEEAVLVPIPAPGGKDLARTRDRDTEALEVPGDRAYIATEQTHHLFRMDVDEEEGPRAARQLPTPPPVGKLRRNVGIEAIAVLPPGHENAGALVVIAEEGRNADEDHPAWITGAPRSLAPKGWAAFTIRNRDGFAITDAVTLPDGRHIAILERRYRPPFSLSMGMRLIRTEDIKPGAIVDGEVLIEANLAEEIDNMEGLAAHRAPDGRIVLTLISDDNFNPIQRTILLRFALADQAE